jgi:hypothetical protein
MKAFKKLLAAGLALALPLSALAQTTAPAEPVKPAEQAPPAPPAPAAEKPAPAKPVIKFKFTGDLNNRMMVYTDQNSIYRTSETISPTAIPNETVEETWGEMKYRLGVEAATESGSVRGVYMMEIGAIRFGNVGGNLGRNSGGGFSGDGVNVETRFAYVDFALPTPKKNRVSFGLQPFLANKWLWNETATALQLQGDTGTVGYTVAWARGVEFLNSTAAHDTMFADADNLYARIDFTPAKDLKTGVFGLYQHRNADVNPVIPTATPPVTTVTAAPSYLLKNFGEVDYDIWNVGLDGSFKFENFFVNFDAIYQGGETNSKTTTAGPPVATATRNFDLASFFLHADLGVNLGAATKVTYTGWYASGDDDANDDDINNFIATDVDTFDSVIFFEGGYTDDNYFTEAPYFLTAGAIFNKLAVEHKVTPKLTAGAAVMYVMTAEDLTIGGGDTSKNLGTEIDASLSYKINPNLELAVNAGYLVADDGMDAFEVNKDGEADRNIFRTTARARYQF